MSVKCLNSAAQGWEPRVLNYYQTECCAVPRRKPSVQHTIVLIVVQYQGFHPRAEEEDRQPKPTMSMGRPSDRNLPADTTCKYSSRTCMLYCCDI